MSITSTNRVRSAAAALATTFLLAACGPPRQATSPSGWQDDFGGDCDELPREEDRVLCEIARRADDEPDLTVPVGPSFEPDDASVAVQVERFGSYDPNERADAVENLAMIAAFDEDAAAAVLAAALLAGEDPAPNVRQASTRLDPALADVDSPADVAPAVAGWLLRGEVPATPRRNCGRWT